MTAPKVTPPVPPAAVVPPVPAPAALPAVAPAPASAPDRIALTRAEKASLADMAGLAEFLSSKRRMFWTNFLMGMGRGVGFAVGLSIVGALFVGIWNEFISVTGLGRFIAQIIGEIRKNLPLGP
ncbi:MAG: DUF5665 domain-containing protein [Planctomycetota bacterium]